jgi:hypothetical protein
VAILRFAGAVQAGQFMLGGSPAAIFDPILLFDSGAANDADVRWASPFNSRVCDERNGEDNVSPIGDAYPDFLCVGAQKKAEPPGFTGNLSRTQISGCLQ